MQSMDWPLAKLARKEVIKRIYEQDWGTNERHVEGYFKLPLDPKSNLESIQIYCKSESGL